jgi:hypothetical protein
MVQLIAANAPEDIDYTKYGIHDALVIDTTACSPSAPTWNAT